MKVGCDIDGVIAESSKELARRVSIQYGIDTTAIETGLYDDFFAENGLDNKWLEKQFQDEWFWTKAEPYSENIDALLSWAEQGHEIHLITGRNEKFTSMVTRGWLRRNNLSNMILSFAPIMHKIDYIKLHEIPVMFEDRFFEANKIGSFGIQSFVVRRPWNEAYEPRVTNPLVQYVGELKEADYFINP